MRINILKLLVLLADAPIGGGVEIAQNCTPPPCYAFDRGFKCKEQCYILFGTSWGTLRYEAVGLGVWNGVWLPRPSIFFRLALVT